MTVDTKPVVETTMLDLVMALNRVATALEQHVMEHVDSHPVVDLSPLPPAYNYEDQGSVAVPPVRPAQAVVAQPQITVAPAAQVCPVHHKPFRDGQYGPYCASKVGNGWCQEKPRAA